MFILNLNVFISASHQILGIRSVFICVCEYPSVVLRV